MLSEASLLRCAGCHGQPWGAHHRHLLVEIFLGFRESEQDNAWLEFVCMQFCKWVYPKSKLWDLKCCSCGNSFVSWRWMHMAISSRCPLCLNFVHCSNRPVRTVGTVAVLYWFFSPAQLTSWYGLGHFRGDSTGQDRLTSRGDLIATQEIKFLGPRFGAVCRVLNLCINNERQYWQEEYQV